SGARTVLLSFPAFSSHRAHSSARCDRTSRDGAGHVCGSQLVRHTEGAGRARSGDTVVSAQPLISVWQASKIYQIGESEVRALDNATIEIHPGELIGIVGPSGSGKTTFLMIAGLLDAPTTGKVLFKGKMVSQPRAPLNDLRDFRRRHMGFVFQK